MGLHQISSTTEVAIEAGTLTARVSETNPDIIIMDRLNKSGKMRQEWWKRDVSLGSGGFGLVFRQKCINGSSRGQLMAVKELREPKNISHADLKTELAVLALFSEPKYHAFFVRSFGWYKLSSKVFIAMEYMPLGDLQSRLIDFGVFSEEDTRLIIRQVLRGVDYMHSSKTAHRDLKPANILIKSAPPDEWWVKLADFGISRRFREPVYIAPTAVGTTGFMAPELFGFAQSSPLSDLERAKKSDIWAIGETLHVMLTGRHSFGISDLERLRTYARGAQGFPTLSLEAQAVSSACIAFIASLMSPRPESRPETRSALANPWAVLPNCYEDWQLVRSGTMRCKGDGQPSVVLSQDDATALVVTATKLYQVNVRSGKVVVSFEDSSADYVAAATSPDGRYAVALDSSSSSLCFRDLQTLERLDVDISNPSWLIEALVAYSHDGRFVAVARFGQIDLWTLDGMDILGASQKATGIAFPGLVAFHSSGKKLLVAYHDGIHCFSIRRHEGSYTLVRSHEIPYPSPGGVTAISPDGKKFARCAGDHIYLWREEMQCWRLQYIGGGDIKSAHFSASGNSLVTASKDGKVIVWRTSGIDLVGWMSVSRENTFSTALSMAPDERLITGSVDDKGPRIDFHRVVR